MLLIVLFFAAFLLRAPAVAAAAIHRGMRLCFTTLIPSLFPFMVLSGILCKSGAGRPLATFLAPVWRRVFHLGGPAALGWLLGNLCGFPIGAKVLSSLAADGELGRQDAADALPMTLGAGPGFVISYVGGTLLCDLGGGGRLYLFQLLSGLVVAFLLRPKEPPRQVCIKPYTKELSLWPLLPAAVAEASISMLTVSATVIFFSALSEVVRLLLSVAGVPLLLQSLLLGMLELTEGVGAETALCGKVGRGVLGFILGFSGLCVHMQICGVLEEGLIKRGRYFLFKSLQGLLCGILCFLFL